MSSTRPTRHEPPFNRGSIRPRSPSEMLEPSRAPAPPNPKKPKRPPGKAGWFVRLVSGMFTVLLVAMLAGAAIAGLVYHQYSRPGPLSVSRVITIPKGESRIEIATRLGGEGVISNRWTFVAAYLLRKALAEKQTELKHGDYEISKNASMANV